MSTQDQGKEHVSTDRALSFITAVHMLTEHCECDALREELMRAQIVVGIRDAKLSEGLQLDPDLTLEKATMSEKANSQCLEGQSKQLDMWRLDIKRKTGGKKCRKRKETQPSGCGRCGNTKRHQWKECPAHDAECRKCHKKGCRSGCGIHDIPQAQMESGEKEGFLGEMCSKEANERVELLQLNGDETVFKLDTGAEVTPIPSSMHSIEKHDNHSRQCCTEQTGTR